MPVHNLSDFFHFGTWDLIKKFIVELHSDLLNSAQSFPSVLNDVVKISPAFVVVEVSGSSSAHTPDLVKHTQDFEILVCLDVFDGFDGARVRSFDVEVGNFGVAAW